MKKKLKKRQTKTPKIYIRDTGLLHTLFDIDNPTLHPIVGASFEGFVIEQILTLLNPQAAYFWRTPVHAELDLLIFHQGKKIGFDIKYTDDPKVSHAMNVCLHDLSLDYLYLITPGDHHFSPQAKVDVLGIQILEKTLKQFTSENTNKSRDGVGV